jgi:plastocyanin
MKRLYRLGIFVVLLSTMMLPGGAFAKGLEQTTSSQTYTVLVGYENAQKGIDVMGFFPSVATIHVGDTVHWKINSVELHTVTFLAGEQAPDLLLPSSLVSGADPTVSPLMFNPAAANPVIPAGGMYDGSTFANSGLMGYESWEAQDFSLTFTNAGTYNYLCLVHGEIMSGRVRVVGPDENAPKPLQEMAMGKAQIASQLAKVPGVMKAANAQIKPDVKNADGSTTHFVTLGYSEGKIDLMQFFPKKTVAKPGDTVIWEMSTHNDAPHTVTFLNGAAAPDLVTVVTQPNMPPFLYINPGTLFPSQLGQDLTRTGLYSSGLKNPIPGPIYTLKIGDMTPGLQPYVCLLHDESGMTGTLMIKP